jgi:hypothetical protein
MHVNEVVEGVYQRLCIHYQDTPPEEKARRCQPGCSAAATCAWHLTEGLLHQPPHCLAGGPIGCVHRALGAPDRAEMAVLCCRFRSLVRLRQVGRPGPVLIGHDRLPDPDRGTPSPGASPPLSFGRPGRAQASRCASAAGSAASCRPSFSSLNLDTGGVSSSGVDAGGRGVPLGAASYGGVVVKLREIGGSGSTNPLPSP